MSSMEFTKTSGKVEAVKARMKDEPDGALDYYIIPGNDAQEMVLHRPDARPLQWMCESRTVNSHLVVSRKKPKPDILVEACYANQVRQELRITNLKDDFDVVELSEECSNWIEWLASQAAKARVGIDPRMISYEESRILELRLAERNSDYKVIYPQKNYVDSIRKQRKIRARRKLISAWHFGPQARCTNADQTGNIKVQDVSRMEVPSRHPWTIIFRHASP
ncbi:hypothetical protein NEOLEDRAFT_765701 [Neolentinus lepideus HHB14362 ss-1]|uniref:Uncharacterized protein n=1 Tax=Neolentinus lepideus HHB14362 ss-1 TaxID=1314782 RepID=A0A165PQ99_9AGAM|nr:hypothetical protein NEOLEDRAFT_765701 [Neolentinus lepideus HHB14362 ss-1]